MAIFDRFSPKNDHFWRFYPLPHLPPFFRVFAVGEFWHARVRAWGSAGTPPSFLDGISIFAKMEKSLFVIFLYYWKKKIIFFFFQYASANRRVSQWIYKLNRARGVLRTHRRPNPLMFTRKDSLGLQTGRSLVFYLNYFINSNGFHDRSVPRSVNGHEARHDAHTN